MTGTIKQSQQFDGIAASRTFLGEASWETSDAHVAAIPRSIDEVKKQIRTSEKQIEEGRFVTAAEAIKHFYQMQGWRSYCLKMPCSWQTASCQTPEASSERKHSGNCVKESHQH